SARRRSVATDPPRFSESVIDPDVVGVSSVRWTSAVLSRPPTKRGGTKPGAEVAVAQGGSAGASARTRAMARPAGAKESAKARSGRASERVESTGPLREGRMPHALGDDERVAAEDNRDVMMLADERAAFEVIEPELAFICYRVSRRLIATFKRS